MLRNDEIMPLLPEQRSPNFFQKALKSAKNLTCKTVGTGIGITSASAVSVITYYKPAYDAGASVAHWLKEAAMIGGLSTNFLFNLQAYRELLQQLPSLVKMPGKLSTAIFFSTMCVAPNLFMNIVDEEGNYIDQPYMVLQIISAFLNIGVNVVGTMELINNISSLLKNKTDLQKEKLIEEINFIIEEFTHKQRLPPDEKFNEELEKELSTQLTTHHDLNLPQKIRYYSLNSALGLFSIPQFSAYLLISYFGMHDLAERKLDASAAISLLLGLIATIGNGIPGAGFSIKGVNSTSKKLMALERPSLLAIFFVLPALLSGFTTHKAMAGSLKELGCSEGNIAEALKWIANLGAALVYNLPQMLNLADSLTAPAANNQLIELKKHLETQVKNLAAANIDDFKNGLGNNVMRFFRDYPAAKNDDIGNGLALHSINSPV
ncbi:MAG: hypothetical protein E6K54_07260 [Gammaproteobacteria bacterium]|nr:MAG: hypothetical protein E6K54_07260 [Gammaproteobacteria bacterium]